MAAITTIVAIGSLALGVNAALENKKAQKAQGRIRDEQQAQNKAQQLKEKRNQIREERVKRARLMQASENTGVADSSGEAGAVGSISSQLGSNLGFNQGAIQASERISAFSQQAADATGNAQLSSALSQAAPVIGGMAESIFKTDPDPLGTFIKQKGIT
jgi:hypothetical protein